MFGKSNGRGYNNNYGGFNGSDRHGGWARGNSQPQLRAYTTPSNDSSLTFGHVVLLLLASVFLAVVLPELDSGNEAEPGPAPQTEPQTEPQGQTDVIATGGGFQSSMETLIGQAADKVRAKMGQSSTGVPERCQAKIEGIKGFVDGTYHLLGCEYNVVEDGASIEREIHPTCESNVVYIDQNYWENVTATCD